MTDENMMTSETLSTEGGDFETGAIQTESVEDSARAVIEELGGISVDGDEPTEPEGEEKHTIAPSEAARILARSKGGAKKGKGEQAKAKAEKRELSISPKEQPGANQEKVEPPQRLSVADKEWFLKQPIEAQRGLRQAYDNLEGHFTKRLQDVQREAEEVREVRDVIKQYRSIWHGRGISEGQAIRELAATGEAIRTKPDETIANLVKVTGVPLERIAQLLGGQAPHQGQAQYQQPAQPQSLLTRDDVLRILQEREHQSSFQTETQRATQEYEQVRNELTPDGRYLYPELWDPNAHGYWSAAYLARVQPLVESLQKTHPGLAHGEKLKRAIHTLRMLDGHQVPPAQTTNGSPSLQSSRLPNREQEIATARNAAVSVRSRGNGLIPAVTQADKPESVEESARATLAAFRSSLN